MVLICLSSAYSIKNDPNKEVKEGLARVEQQTNGDFWFGGIKYQLNSAEKTAMVIYQGGTTSGNKVIPETLVYNGVTFRVTSIDHDAFSRCDNLTSVTIPNSVTSIGMRAFCGCISLKSITLPSTITSIKSETFKYCHSLASIKIPEGVTSIETYAFNECLSLTSIIIPESVTSMGSAVFISCRALTSVVLPKNITKIESGTFEGCALKSITIPNRVTSIGSDAFYYCEGLTSVVIPNSVKTIERGAFSRCINLKSVTIPNSVETIGVAAFEDCSALSSVIIPNSVTSIGSYAFQNCPLKTVKIPDSVKKLGELCFADNYGLRTASVPSTIEDFGEGGPFANTSLGGTVTVRYPKGITKKSTDRIWFVNKRRQQKENERAESRAADPNSMSWPSPKITKDWHWEHGDYVRTVYWHGLGLVTFKRYEGFDYYYGVLQSTTRTSSSPSAGRLYKTYKDAEAYAYFELKYGITRDRGYVNLGKTPW